MALDDRPRPRPRSRPWIVTRQVTAAPEAEPVAGGTAVLFSARSPAKESDNEDAAAVFAVDARRAVLAVADGLGGHPAGDEAAETALRALGRCVAAAAGSEANLRSAILDGF